MCGAHAACSTPCASIANIGGGYVFFLLMPVTWAELAFRPESLDPRFIQIMNDWVWFAFLMIFIAVAILCDHNTPTIFLRWVAFYSLWSAVLIFPAGLIEFFKEGPFAYDGLISFWFVYVVFFGWIVVRTAASPASRSSSSPSSRCASSSWTSWRFAMRRA